MYYSRSLFFDNSNHIVFANRAMANLRLKKFDKAEEDCTAPLSIEPTYVKALTRRGMARHKRGKYVEAIEDFKKAIELQPSNKELKKLMQSSKKMYDEVGGIVSGGKAAEQNGSSRISIVEVDDDDEEDESDEENESDGGEHATVENSDDYIPAKKFQGRKPGYVFKKDQSGLGYYLDPVQQPVVNDIETRVATSTKSESPKSVDSDGYVQLESPTNKDSAMTAEDRMKFGMEAKEEGSKFFKSGKLGNAYRSFSRAIDLFPADHEEEVKCLNNRALVSMRLSNHEDVVNDCTRVLESKSGKDNVKALLRRGAAREELGRFQEALDDMCSVMKLDPSREPVSNAISRLLVKMQNNNGTKSPREKKVDSKAATPAKKQKKPTRGEKQSVNVEKKKMKDEKKILENAKAKAVKEKRKQTLQRRVKTNVLRHRKRKSQQPHKSKYRNQKCLQLRRRRSNFRSRRKNTRMRATHISRRKSLRQQFTPMTKRLGWIGLV